MPAPDRHPGLPSRPLGYAHAPMTRDEAIDHAIDFGRRFGVPCRVIACGAGYNAAIPMEFAAGMTSWAARNDPAEHGLSERGRG